MTYRYGETKLEKLTQEYKNKIVYECDAYVIVCLPNEENSTKMGARGGYFSTYYEAMGERPDSFIKLAPHLLELIVQWYCEKYLYNSDDVLEALSDGINKALQHSAALSASGIKYEVVANLKK